MFYRIAAAMCGVVLMVGCPSASSQTTVRDAGAGPSLSEAQAMHYDGPQARIAVARFDNRAGNQGRWWSPAIGDGMADMLTTALFNTGRFIVLERDAIDDVLYEQDLGASGRIRPETAAAIGEIEGAELLVVAAVTEFQEDASGTRGSIGGGRLGRAIGGVVGGQSSAHMAIDLRIIDARTSRVLAATSVEGTARDFDIGGALAGYTGRHAMSGSLSTWQNTPREKALREVIGKSVEYIMSRTPQTYYRHGSGHQAATAQAAAPAAAAQASSTGERVVITANSLNVRSGPNPSANVEYTLVSGNIVDVMAKAGDWMQVRDDQGRVGWVASEHTLVLQ